MTSISKNIAERPNLQTKESQIKNEHSINQLLSPKKQYFNQLSKKKALNNITSAKQDKSQNDSKNNSTPFKHNDYSNYQTTLGCYNLGKSNQPSKSSKNANRNIIHYSNNINVHKEDSNAMSLFTIQEKIMNMSNGLLTKSINSNSYYKKSKEPSQAQTEKSASLSSKLFQLRKQPYPMNYNANSLKTTTTPHKSTKKNKSIKYSQNQYNSNPNNFNSTKLSSNNNRKRTKNTIKTQDSATPKRFNSLNRGIDNKISSQTNNNIRSTYTSKKPNAYYSFYNKVLSKSKDKSVGKEKTKLKINNERNQNNFKRNKLSKSLKKETYLTHECTNLTTYNNKREYNKKNSNKDIQMTQTSHNSFLFTKHYYNCNYNYNSLDSSTDCNRANEETGIKVNCKQKEKENSYTGRMVIKKYSKYLSQFEIDELCQFASPIYYVQSFEHRVKNNIQFSNNLVSTFSSAHFPNYIKGGISLPRAKSYKYFYDVYSEVESYNNEEENYIITPGEHIYFRYEILELLGKGSFGEAVKCLDHKTKEVVCVKIIKANGKFSLQAMIETKILQHIRKNDSENNTNIVKFFSQFIFRNHICLVFEILDINLYEFLKINDYNGFALKKIKSFAIELLFTLLFLKRQKIIHCDLKPENILISKEKKNQVKVIDFGSSCFENEKLYTYIQSRFYRAPEVILDQGYGMPIDMWSLGCILPELLTGVPIFPGENEKDQLVYIIEYLGMPSTEYINKCKKKSIFFDERNQAYPHYNPDGSLRLPKSKSIIDFLKGTSDLFQDFVKKCICWSPKDRMSPETALMHNWIIKDMTSEALCLHKRKISTIKIGHCQIHKLNSLPTSLRPIRTNNKKISSKSDHSHHSSHSIKFPKTPNKTPIKRTASKDIHRNPSTTKYSLSKKKAFTFRLDTYPYSKKNE